MACEEVCDAVRDVGEGPVKSGDAVAAENVIAGLVGIGELDDQRAGDCRASALA